MGKPTQSIDVVKLRRRWGKGALNHYEVVLSTQPRNDLRYQNHAIKALKIMRTPITFRIVANTPFIFSHLGIYEINRYPTKH